VIYQLYRTTTTGYRGHEIEIDMAASWLPPVTEACVTFHYCYPPEKPGRLAILNTLGRRAIRLTVAQHEAVRAGQAITVFAPTWTDAQWWLILVVAAAVYGVGLALASALVAGSGAVMLIALQGLTLVAGWLSTIDDQRWLLRWLVLLAGIGAVLVPALPLVTSMPLWVAVALVVTVAGSLLGLTLLGMLHVALNAASAYFEAKDRAEGGV
jgi:hypothetical protein